MLNYFYDLAGNMMGQKAAGGLPPQIVGQPVKRISEPGQMVTFSVVVVDVSGVTFQWKFNGADIQGATGDSLLLTNVSAANEGQYSVVVTNSAGSVTSAPAALMLDSDRDGLPDSWEIANFGDLTNQTSEGDPDHDAISNLDEFFDGTNPNSGASQRPRLVAYSDAGGSVTVTPMKLSYDLEEAVTLTATPTTPSVFVGWAGDLNTGDLLASTNPVTFAMIGDKTVRARFASVLPPPPGLVAFWRGETDATDLIGGHNGAFFAGASVAPPSLTRVGKVGGAFAFDGTVYVHVPDAPELKPDQITAEAWIFPTLMSGDHQTVIARGSPTNDDDAWWMGLLNSKPRFWSKHVGSGMLLLEAPSAIPMNVWTHLAISFDGVTKRLYVNGAQVASQGGLGALIYEPAPPPPALPPPVTIGSDWAFNASRGGFNGLVDEVAIYNRALTITEVFEAYNADIAGKDIARPYFTSPSPLPDAAPGANFSFQLTTALGTAPITFSVSAGALPLGITLSTVGSISGASSIPGTYDFFVLATDTAGSSTEQIFVLRVLEPVALPADMLAWWRGEPSANASVSDTIGGHDGGFFRGTTPTPPTYTSDGKVGSAVTFDGTVSVRVPDAAELRPEEMTAEAWVFPTLRSGNHQAIIALGSSTNDDDAYWMGLLNGMPRFWSKHVGSGMLLLEAPSAIPLNAWTHLAISFGGTTKRLYVNGAQVASMSGVGPLVYEPAAPPALPPPVTIGADWAHNAPVDIFSGRLDEVTLYRRALSSDEIVSIVDAGPAGKQTTGPYINSPSQLPVAFVGQAYSHTYTSVRGAGPVVYTLSTSSALPAALTLTPVGVLSGVPVSAGSYAFVMRATDATGQFMEQQCAFQAFKSVQIPAGVIGWWKAEGNAQDSSGSNHGTLRNGAGFSAGKVGQAFSFDGSTGFVEIPDAPALRPLSITFEAWVAFDTISGIRVVLSKPVGAGTSDSYGLWLQDGVLKGVVGDSAGIGPILSTTLTLAPGRWYHVAYTFDDSTKQQVLYVDGIQAAFGVASKPIGYDGQPVLLGRDTENGAPNFFLGGRIDEAAIYGRALSGTEIASVYNAGVSGKHP